MEDKSLILSKKRTHLAATRTLLSHLRTTLICISVAFAFMKLDKEHPIDAFTITLFVLSVLFTVIGIIQFFITKSNIEKL